MIRAKKFHTDKYQKLLIVSLTILFFISGCIQQKSLADKIDNQIKKMMKTGKVQGMAVSVSKGGKVFLSEGYGYADVTTRRPVSPETLFFMASSAKPFTAMTLGLLVDKKLLEWDRPIKEYISYFELFENSATHQMTPRDILCHRSGLARHDLVWHGLAKDVDAKAVC